MATKRIALSGRRPIVIDTEQWSRIADATGDSGRYGPGMTPRRLEEYSTWQIVARQHNDGRVLVYVVTDDSGAVWGRPLPSGCHDGGELLEPGADVVEAIQRVGRDCGVPASEIRDCVASLAPEVLP